MPILSLGNGWGTISKFFDDFTSTGGQMYSPYRTLKYRPKSCVIRPFFYIGKLILAYACSIFFVYVFIPLQDMYFALKNIIWHAHFKSNQDNKSFQAMTALKLFEQIGEAVPQLCIAAIFYTSNWHWLSEWDRVMGIVTLTLSAGSIIMGLVKGGMFLRSSGRNWHTLFKVNIQFIFSKYMYPYRTES